MPPKSEVNTYLQNPIIPRINAPFHKPYCRNLHLAHLCLCAAEHIVLNIGRMVESCAQVAGEIIARRHYPIVALTTKNNNMTSFVLTLVENCIEEWNYFRNQTINQDGRVTKEGMKETDEGYWQRVGIYWLEGTGRELSGRNTDYPWSAAFISYH